MQAMTPETDIPSLFSLEYIPYLNANGQLTDQFQGIGVYAIFDQEKVLQFVGYSRDVELSLKQHLIRQPQKCYWFKLQTIARPSRTILESIRDNWTAENGSLPVGNRSDQAKWTQPIDAKVAMTSDEQTSYKSGDELMQSKLLKTVARRVESEVLAQLESRGVKMQIRFNPKLKERGLLDLK